MEQMLIEKEDTAKLCVELGGDNSVDANLLVRTIHNFVDITELAKNDLAPDSNIKLTVKAFRPGSFIIDFDAIVKTLTSDMLANFVTSAGAIIGVVVACFKLVKHLAGEKPKNIEENQNESSLKIENNSGKIINISADVFNLYSKPSANDTLAKIFNDLEEDKSRTTLKVSSKDTSIDFDSREFKALSTPTSLVGLNNQIISSTFVADVFVKKPDLLGNSKWEVYFNKIIRVAIEDKNFLDRVHKRQENFSGGDRIRVRLRMESEYDSTGMPIEGSERYFIEEVLSAVLPPLHPMDNQISLFKDID